MKKVVTTSHGEVLIRPCIPQDATAFRALRLEALKGHPTQFGSDYEEALEKPDEYWIQRVTLNPDEEAVFLAEKDGKLVGMTGIYRGSGKKGRHAAGVWGVYVQPGLRGAHIAEALIRACLGWARAKGIVIARLGVGVDNKPAIRCYERCGFVTYGIEEKSGYYDGRYFDEYLMAVSLE
jgi:ribosomal protein S18 acetylase RimI-like enzyme